jgi:hypothetical protein
MLAPARLEVASGGLKPCALSFSRSTFRSEQCPGRGLVEVYHRGANGLSAPGSVITRSSRSEQTGFEFYTGCGALRNTHRVASAAASRLLCLVGTPDDRQGVLSDAQETHRINKHGGPVLFDRDRKGAPRVEQRIARSTFGVFVDVPTSYPVIHGTCHRARLRHLLLRTKSARVLRERSLVRLRIPEMHEFRNVPQADTAP